jgi:hypothetical protein
MAKKSKGKGNGKDKGIHFSVKGFSARSRWFMLAMFLVALGIIVFFPRMPYGSPLNSLEGAIKSTASIVIVVIIALSWWGGQKEKTITKKEEAENKALEEENKAAKIEAILAAKENKEAAEFKKPLVVKKLEEIYLGEKEIPDHAKFLASTGWDRLVEKKANFSELTVEQLVIGAQLYLQQERLAKSQ